MQLSVLTVQIEYIFFLNFLDIFYLVIWPPLWEPPILNIALAAGMV